MTLPEEVCSFATQPLAPLETVQEVTSLKRGLMAVFDRKHRKNNMSVLFPSHFPKGTNFPFDYWKLEMPF